MLGETTFEQNMSCEEVRSQYITTLRNFDTDNNGQISLEEARAAANAFGRGEISQKQGEAVVSAWGNNCSFDPYGSGGGGSTPLPINIDGLSETQRQIGVGAISVIGALLLD